METNNDITAFVDRGNYHFQSSGRRRGRRRCRPAFADPTIQTLNHFTGDHPPFITNDTDYYFTYNSVYGYMEQLFLIGKRVPYTLGQMFNNMHSWKYRDTDYTKYDALFTALAEAGDPITNIWITENDVRSPKTNELFTPNQCNQFYNWRRRVFWPEIVNFDNYTLTHVPCVTTEEIKPLPLHVKGESMDHWPLYGSNNPLNIRLFGWFFPQEPVYPDVSSWILADLPSGAKHWQGANLTLFKQQMATITGQPNPYYHMPT